MGLQVYLSTAPPAEAARIAKRLIELKLAACINVFPGVRSYYTWQDEPQEEVEAFLVIKSAANASELTAAYTALHPYDIPAFTCIDVIEGSSLDSFVAWTKEQSLALRS